MKIQHLNTRRRCLTLTSAFQSAGKRALSLQRVSKRDQMEPKRDGSTLPAHAWAVQIQGPLRAHQSGLGFRTSSGALPANAPILEPVQERGLTSLAVRNLCPRHLP